MVPHYKRSLQYCRLFQDENSKNRIVSSCAESQPACMPKKASKHSAFKYCSHILPLNNISPYQLEQVAGCDPNLEEVSQPHGTSSQSSQGSPTAATVQAGWITWRPKVLQTDASVDVTFS